MAIDITKPIRSITYNGDTVPLETRSKEYTVTLAKSSGWVLLVSLDSTVLSHINDDDFQVSLIRQETYEYDWYSGNAYFCNNRPVCYSTGVSSNPVYGYSNRMQSATNTSFGGIYLPANNTVQSDPGVGFGCFYVNSGNYYIRPSDGAVQGGTYTLRFSW